MTSTVWDSRRHTLRVARGDGLVTGNIVAVGAGDRDDVGGRGENARVGVLEVGADASRQAAVRIVASASVDEGCVVVSTELVDELRLEVLDEHGWRLSATACEPAARIVLEPLTENRLDDVSRQLRNAKDIVGQQIHLGSGDAWVFADGESFRVRQVFDRSGRERTDLCYIDPETELDVFLAGNRNGVDIVILADCSGSMSWDDIEDHADVVRLGLRRRSNYISRMDALKRSLMDMVEIRRHVTGRVARIALVKFTTTSMCVFPRSGSMAEIQGPDDERTLREFQGAIGLLRPENAATDIGQALHFASDLLHRHGVPGNDRLIVLVSDGADWKQQGEETAGEAVVAIADPVSLMEELHEFLNINLHAVGIGDRDTFMRWWQTNRPAGHQDPHISVIPNHTLLRELVQVGGGDPSRTGGVDVLHGYFADLGTGVAHHVGKPSDPGGARLQSTIDTLHPAGRRIDSEMSGKLASLSEESLDLRTQLNDLSRRCGESDLFGHVHHNKLLHLGRPLHGARDFTSWIMDCHHAFGETLDRRLKGEQPKEPKDRYGIDGVYDKIRDWRMDAVRRFRNADGHAFVEGRDAELLGAVCLKLTGRKVLADDDAESWTRLQVGLLAGVIEVLRNVKTVLENAPLSARAEQYAEVFSVEGY
ncbi:vWA domain-containing protein [Nocardia sp. NPDC004168]|uniref:vWA domain-containing protein n=1 Tax=Nocardia sp. NPDC004168 TaxID=3154452 RepID=UPI0033A89B7F